MSENTPAAEQTFEQQVNAAISTMVEKEDGTWALPETAELPEPVKYAAVLEKRRRDTQAAYSKSQQSIKQLEAENRRLAEAWQADALAKMTLEQREELDQLKHDDPDAWRAKLNAIEQEGRASFDSTRQEIAKKAHNESEVEYRERILAEFEAANPGFKLTDEIIDSELPPKFLKQLEKGEVTFEQYLVNCKNYLSANKVLKTDNLEADTVSLSKTGGSVTIPEDALAKASATSYEKETY